MRNDINCSCVLLYYFYPLLAFVVEIKIRLNSMKIFFFPALDHHIREEWTGFILLGVGITELTSPLLGSESKRIQRKMNKLSFL